MRVRGFPFGAEVESFLREHNPVFVVEQNRDAQLMSLLTIETSVSKEKLRSVRAYGGFPLQAAQVVKGIESQLGVRADRGDGHTHASANGAEAAANGGTSGTTSGATSGATSESARANGGQVRL